jgi:DNA (cytosine-5)-methyltransferase 1
VAPRPLRVLSLFSGAGGLDLGIHAAVPARVVCYVEREAYAAAVLVSRMRDGGLDEAPVWSDVSTFDARPWRGAVDLVCGGFPCQDISNAGKRAGIEGERSGLWSEFARIIREVGPRYVFVENVSALLVRGLGVVLGDLRSLGFDAEWGVLRASDAGAPHRRERLFILAHAHGDGREGERRDVPVLAVAPAGNDADGRGGAAPALGDSDGARLEGHGRGVRGGSARREHGGERAPWPPGPDDAAGWLVYLERWPGSEPAVCRGTDGLAHRVDRLRLCGNGVVPQQAELAFRALWDRLHGGRMITHSVGVLDAGEGR